MRGLIARLDRGIGHLLDAAAWLALPVTLLLFAQWPLRDLVHGYATSANDLAQWLFALYVSAALVAATRSRQHLASDLMARHYNPARRHQIERVAGILFVAPWSLAILLMGGPSAWRSVAALEAFPETYSPGYFVIKLAVLLLALLLLLQTVLDLLRTTRA